jgi:GR25 family glycosyltransferase involved in LPS biosynthesis
MTNIYNYFDDIVCINLDFRKDRKEEAQNNFTKLNIPAKFLTVKKHEKGGRYGCFDSHIKVLKYAQQNNYKNILVFEDDFMPTKGYDEKIIKKAVEFMQNNQDWDIFYFGYTFMNQNLQTIFTAPNYSDNIIIYKALLTHSLCYSQRGINKILSAYKPHLGKIQYDIFLINYNELKSYCILPLMFDQNCKSEYNNSTHSLLEDIVRSLNPVVSYLDLHYNMSLLRYKYKKFLIYSFIVFVCILLIYLMIKHAKNLKK